MMALYLVPYPVTAPTISVQSLRTSFFYAPISYPANGAVVGQIWPEYLEPTP